MYEIVYDGIDENKEYVVEGIKMIEEAIQEKCQINQCRTGFFLTNNQKHRN